MRERVTAMALQPVARLRRLAGNLLIAAFVAMAIGLTQNDPDTPRPGADSEGPGLIVSSEVIGVWVPGSLVDLHRCDPSAALAETHQQLKTILERRGLENVWYAITVRGSQANHRTEDISYIRHPYRQAEHFSEFLDVLTTVAETSSRQPSADPSATIVHIVPTGTSARKWLEALQASTPE